MFAYVYIFILTEELCYFLKILTQVHFFIAFRERRRKGKKEGGRERRGERERERQRGRETERKKGKERERGRDRQTDRDRDKHHSSVGRETSTGCLHMCPNWGSNLQPSYVICLGIEPSAFWCMG